MIKGDGAGPMPSGSAGGAPPMDLLGGNFDAFAAPAYALAPPMMPPMEGA
jgi:hypothetical protein